jgi:hypothetical protein
MGTLSKTFILFGILSSAFLEQIGALKLRRALTYDDYSNKTAMQYSGYSEPRDKIPRNLMNLGLTYSKQDGFGYSSGGSNAGNGDTVFPGIPPKDSPQAVMGIVNKLLADPGMRACDSNLYDQQCVIARKQLEEYMFRILQTMEYSMPSAFTNLIELFRRLRLAEMQVQSLNLTLNGDGVTPGLVKKMDILNTVNSQEEARMDAAYQNVQDVVSQRRDLMYREQYRLTQLDKNAERTLKDVSSQLVRVNTAKANIALSKVRRDMANAITDTASQAEKVGADWSEGLNELEARYRDWYDDTTSVIGVETDAAKAGTDDAKTLSRLMRATLDVVGKEAALVAQNEQRDWQGNADRMLREAATSESKAFNDKHYQVAMDTVNQTFGDLFQTMNTAAFNRETPMRNVKNLADSLVPWLKAELKSAMSDVFDAAGSLFKTGDSKAKFLAQMAADIGKLVADQKLKAQTGADLGNDAIRQLQVEYDYAIGKAADAANQTASQVKSDVSKLIGDYGNELSTMSSDSSQTASDMKDSASAKTADLSAQAGSTSLASADSLSSGTDAASTSGALNNAQLKSVLDTAVSTLETHADALNAALVDSKSTVGEISASTGADTANMVGNLQDQISGSTSEFGVQTQQVQVNLEDYMKAFLGDTMTNAQAFSGTNTDASNAIGAMNEYASNVNTRIADLGSQIQSAALAMNESIANLDATLPSEPALMNSSVDSANSVLSSGVTSQVDEYMTMLANALSGTNSSLMDQLGVVQYAVNAQLEDAQDTIGGMQVNQSALVSEMAHILGQLTDLPVPGTEGSAKILLNKQMGLATVSLIQTLRNQTKMFSNKASGLQSDVRNLVQNKTDQLVHAISESANSLSQTLGTSRDSILNLSTLTHDVLNEIVLRTNQSKLRFDDFGFRVNSSQSGLVNVGQRARDLLVNTQSRIQDITNRVIQVLTEKTHYAVNATDSAKNNSWAVVDSAIEKVQQGPQTLSHFAANGTVNVDDFKAFIDSQAQSFHNRIADALHALGTTILRRKAAIEHQFVRSSMNLTQSEWKLFDILTGVSKSLTRDANSSDDQWSQAQARLDQHRSMVASQLAKLTNKMNANYAKLQLIARKHQLGVDQKLAKYLASLGSDLSQSDANLSAAFDFFKGSADSSTAWTNNAKRAYSISGMLRNLSLRNQGRLQGLLEKVTSGQMSFQDALAEARKIDLDGIQSANDAVSLLMGSMIDYQQALYRAFGDSGDRLNASVVAINHILDTRAPDVLINVGVVSNASDSLAQHLNDFLTYSQSQLAQDSLTVADIQTAMEQNRTAVNLLIGDIKSRIDTIEGEMKANELDYENWIDGVIADELQKADTKGRQLQQKLGVSPSSFVQDLNAVHPYKLQLELEEIRRRAQRT